MQCYNKPNGGAFMYFHLVAVSEVDNGSIAFHVADKDIEKLKDSQKKLMLMAEDLKASFSFHVIQTEKPNWNSIVELDSYFKNMLIFDDEKSFIEEISDSSTITAEEIAGFLQKNVGISSNLKIQKLLYFIYSKILILTGNKLFNEPIQAWDYGPVVPEVYSSFKWNELPSPNILLNKLVMNKQREVIIESIEYILKKYGDRDAFDLIDLTHRVDTPWSKVFKRNENRCITDNLIIEYNKLHPDEL